MLSVLRKKIPLPRVRRRRPAFPSESVSNHLLRDLGFDNAQVREILEFVEGAKSFGVRWGGNDAELSYRARVAANSNEAPEETAGVQER